jgi:DNA-binding transcriptional ArsR family regulator
MTLLQLVNLGDALSHPLRIKILKKLLEKERNVYELAKDLQISRQLLYLHLRKLEKAELVESDLRLEGSKAKKYYRLKNFNFKIDINLIRDVEV